MPRSKDGKNNDPQKRTPVVIALKGCAIWYKIVAIVWLILTAIVLFEISIRR